MANAWKPAKHWWRDTHGQIRGRQLRTADAKVAGQELAFLRRRLAEAIEEVLA